MDYNKEFITKKEFCTMCGISESTGSKLIKQGTIPFEKCNEGLLHFYAIPFQSAIDYIKQQETKGVLSDDEISKRRKFYQAKMKKYPDVISAKDICNITGYGKETIRQWINNEKILGIVVRKRFKVAKEDLIDFLVTPYYENIIRKSKTHIKDNRIITNN